MVTEENVKILLVEDDTNLGFLLKTNLEPKGFTVEICMDGEEGWRAFQQRKFDICILDVMLPKKDGFSLARQIREKDNKVPIIFLTAKTMEEDKLKGFKAGCDDYVTKPFSAKELLFRIKAIMRRCVNNNEVELKDEICQIGGFTLDYGNRRLSSMAGEQKLSTKEADLLYLLASHKNALLNRNTILIKVWGTDDYFASKSMDVYLTRIRKILRPDPALEIQNIHGTGFRLIERQASALSSGKAAEV